MKRFLSAVSVLSLCIASAATAAHAASNKALVTVTVGTVGASTPVAYTINRSGRQVGGVACTLNDVAVACPLPTGTGKTSTGAFDVSPVEGSNTVNVTVTLTDGGVASGTATFVLESTAASTCMEYNGTFASTGTSTWQCTMTLTGYGNHSIHNWTDLAAFTAHPAPSDFQPFCAGTYDNSTAIFSDTGAGNADLLIFSWCQ